MHRLLKRQVKQVFGKDFNLHDFDTKTVALLENITETYENFDEEKKFLNHTINDFTNFSSHAEDEKKKFDLDLEKNLDIRGYADGIPIKYINKIFEPPAFKQQNLEIRVQV